LDNDANRNAKMQDGKTPMDFAEADGFPKIVELLI